MIHTHRNMPLSTDSEKLAGIQNGLDGSKSEQGL